MNGVERKTADRAGPVILAALLWWSRQLRLHSAVKRVGAVTRRTLRSFYDDQMTHHAAALTYYALMSLFPAVLLALSLLGLLGQYPETYNAIIGYLREVAPESVVDPLIARYVVLCRTRGPQRPLS